MKKVFSFIIGFLIIFSANTFAQNTVENTYIVKLKPQYRNLFQQKSISSLINDEQAILKPTFPNHKALLEKTDSRMVDLSLIYTLVTDKNKTQELLLSGYFEYVQPKYIHHNLFVPDDELISNQWHLNTIKAFDAWDVCTGDSNVVIGISDSGIDTIVSDIVDNIKYNYNDPIDGIDNDNDGFIDNFRGWNTAANNNNIYKVVIHGTFVAGLSSSVTDNNNKIAGVGYHCKFLPVCNQTASLGITGGYESIVYAADHGCSIINCSWGGVSPYDQFGQDVINYATFNKGALVVAAAGNTNARLSFYPAAFDNVLSVAATNINDEKADFSTYDYSVDIAAPGKAVYSCLGNSYGTSDGTSFSAPIVSGVAALVKSYYPSFTPQQIIHRLKATADIIDTINTNVNYAGMLGSGRINAYRALTDTLMPSLEWHHICYNQDIKNAGDTIAVYGIFTNYLADGSNINARIETLTPQASLLTNSISIGQLSTLEDYTLTTPLFLTLNQPLSESQNIILKISYFEDTTFLNTQYVPLYFTPCVTMNVNEQICTITGNGRLGYDDINYKYGEGLHHRSQTQTMLSFGSFMFGTNSSHISDNIPGIDHDKEMKTLVLPHIIKDTARADMQIEAVFNDDEAGNTKLGIEVQHTAMAWTNDTINKTIIHQYVMTNKSNNTVNQLYAALYMDWDIGISSCNRIQYDENYRMSYISPIYDGMFAGVKYLSPYSTKTYAFDNNGSNLSMNISNGMTDLQKYNAMTTNRFEAGMSTYGNDVSLMSTYGPLNMEPGDSVRIAYAIIIGNHLSDLRNNATAAQSVFDTLYMETPVEDTTSIINGKIATNCKIYPQPAKNNLYILTPAPMNKIMIYDIAGKLIEQHQNIYQNHQNIDISRLPTGMYVIKIHTPENIFIQKFVKD